MSIGDPSKSHKGASEALYNVANILENYFIDKFINGLRKKENW